MNEPGSPRIKVEFVLIGLILLVALLFRVWGINFDLPYIYNPDEPIYVTISLDMFKTGDLNPHYFRYPSLFFYINSFAYLPYYLFGKYRGIFISPSDILGPLMVIGGVAKAPMPNTILLGRLISVIFGVGTVGLTFVIGKRLIGKASVGWIAALMMAVSQINVVVSRSIIPDPFMIFFSAAAFLAAVLVYQQGKTWQYLVAGLCVGLAASSKYNGGLIVLPLLFAHFLRYGKRAFKERNLYLALIFSGLGFLAATPFALFDLSKFLSDLMADAHEYTTGHPGNEGDTLLWYMKYMLRTANVIYILALLEILRGFYSRSKEILLLSVFPILYFIFINRFIVRNAQTLLPINMFSFLLAASFLIHLLDHARAIAVKPLRISASASIIGLIIVSITMQTYVTVTGIIQQTTVNSRKIAVSWIDQNLPKGSKIGIEMYSPYVDPTRFSLEGHWSVIDQNPEWYVEQGFDFVILSEGAYGRYFGDPERYQAEISQYEKFFNRFRLKKLFTDGGYEVRIYKVR